MSDPGSLRVGSVIGGDYRICGLLRHASSGSVFRAEQIRTGAFRALKVLAPELVEDDGTRVRFEREARLSSAISSDHIEQVLDAGVDGPTGLPWIALELLTGETVAERLKRKGAFDVKSATLVFEQTIHALAAAHAAGIVHRDLAPEKVLITRGRNAQSPTLVKVLDFGLAKLLALAPTSNTVVGGNPLWVAPEQLAALPNVTPACDVWAMGLVFFAMLTGKPFWRGGARATLPDLYNQVMREDIPRASDRAIELGCMPGAVPASFDDFFAHCLKRSPEERFVTAAEALEAFRNATTADDDDDRTLLMPRPPERGDGLPAFLLPNTRPPPPVLPTSTVSFRDEAAPAAAPPASRRGRPKVPPALVLLAVAVGLALVVNVTLLLEIRPSSSSTAAASAPRTLDRRYAYDRKIARAAERKTTPDDVGVPPAAPRHTSHARGADRGSRELAASSPPAPEEAGGKPGLLSVVCVPACDEVLVDGRALGESPLYRQLLPSGEHKVTLKWSEPDAEQTLRVHIAAGDEPTVLRKYRSPE